MIKFREKVYSFSDFVNNVQTGVITASTLASLVISNKDIIKNPIIKKSLLATSIGISVLSGLSLLYDYYRKRLSKTEAKRSTNHNLNEVMNLLSKSGKKEGNDFFIDPKEADSHEAKVSIVIRRDLGAIDLIVNCTNDPDIAKVTENLAKNFPDKNKIHTRVTDRGVELMIYSIDTSYSSEYIAGIVNSFLDRKIPVYLLEINR